MNHGGMAYISVDRIIRLSEDLLKPISVAEGSQLTAVYYPTPVDGEYKDYYLGIAHQPDFMLTPIPYNAWPYSAGMRVDIKHQKGAFADVTAFLRDREVNIIMAQCTRSGHRHATWTLAVDFEGLRKNRGGLPGQEELHSLGQQLETDIRSLKSDIQKACKSAIPDPASTPYLRNPVGCWPLKGLVHFFEVSQKNSVSQPFRAECRSKDTIDIRDVSTEAWSHVRNDLPTLGFASMDTDLFNIRVAVLKPKNLQMFRSLTVHYQMDTLPQRSSLGVLDSIADSLRDKWNLWRVYNQTHRKTSTREEGTIQMFAEHTDSSTTYEKSEIDRDLKRRIQSASEKFKDLDFHKPVLVSTISPHRIFVSMKNESEFRRHHDVLRICQDLSRKIGVLPEDVITVKNYTTDSVTNEVIEQIRGCSGMLQFFMGEGSSMEWLSGEFFLSCFLKMPCVRFVDPALYDQIKFQKDHPAKLMRMDICEADLSKTIEEALIELGNKMRW